MIIRLVWLLAVVTASITKQDDLPTVGMYWNGYLIPFGELELRRDPERTLIKLYNTIVGEWKLMDVKTWHEFPLDHKGQSFRPQLPVSTDLGYFALLSLLKTKLPCALEFSHEPLTTQDLVSIPPAVYREFKPKDFMTLIQRTSFTKLLNHMVSIDLGEVFLRKALDKAGKCLLVFKNGQDVFNSEHIDLTGASVETIQKTWSLMPAHLKPNRILASMTPELWQKLVIAASQKNSVSIMHVEQWSAMTVLTDAGLLFPISLDQFTLSEIEGFVQHFCCPQQLSQRFVKRIESFTQCEPDPKYYILIVPMLKFFWKNVLKVPALSTEVINDYIFVRDYLGNHMNRLLDDPFRVFLEDILYSSVECDSGTAKAFVRLWKYSNLKQYVLAPSFFGNPTVTEALLTSGLPEFAGVNCLMDILKKETLIEPSLLPLVRKLNSEFNDRVDEDVLKMIASVAMRQTVWSETRVLAHLVLIHQSQFYSATEIPIFLAKAVLADIGLAIPSYYLETAKGITTQLQGSQNPFAFLRDWCHHDHKPSYEFFKLYISGTRVEDEACTVVDNGQRSVSFNLDHGRLNCMFHSVKSRLFIKELITFIWWSGRRTMYKCDLLTDIYDELKRRCRNFLTLDLVLREYCEYFGVQEVTWPAVIEHARGDCVLLLNLLCFINLFEEVQDLSPAISDQFFREEQPYFLAMSLDMTRLHPYIKRKIHEIGLITDPESNDEWLKDQEADLTLRMLESGAMTLEYLLLHAEVYRVNWTRVAERMKMNLVFLKHMVENREGMDRYAFYTKILEVYEEHPAQYLVQVFEEHNRDVAQTIAYLNANTQLNT